MKITIDVSTRLVRDIDRWAKERRTSRERAAAELARIGAEMTTPRYRQHLLKTIEILRKVHDSDVIIVEDTPRRSKPH